jgi:flagellar hook-associated protein 2
MAGLQLSGLVSNLDWKSLVDQLIAAESTPITRIRAEQQKNDDRAGALSALGEKMAALGSAVSALKAAGTFATRAVTSSAATGAWTATSDLGGATGSVALSVTQLATATKRVGASEVGRGLSASGDVSGVTLATLRGAVPVTAGTLTINGHKITVSTADSLQDVFAAVRAATGVEVVGAYEPATDKVTLTSSSGTISLGAANDTSNLWRVLKISGGAGDAVESVTSIASLSTKSALAAAGLKDWPAGVDASGAGSFQINGETIAYNLNTDSALAVITRINASSAGVTASYDVANDRFVLTNNRPGHLGISVSESSPGLLQAFGLITGATTQEGADARFSVNGGPTLSAPGNTLEVGDHGIPGLHVTVTSTGAQTFTVDHDTAAMRAKIDAVLGAYNAVQSYIDDQTRITTKNGKVTAGVLSTNREIQEWARNLRESAFETVTGLAGSVSRLDDLGIGFSGLGTALNVLDETKLTNALEQRPSQVADFFQNSTGGMAVKLNGLINRFSALNDSRQTQLKASNADLDRQIADLQRRLDQQKELLTNSFVAMESAQSKIQQQGQAITKAYFSGN